MMSDLRRDCPWCGQERLFEQPHPVACPDVADGICPEWACIACGTALITATFPAAPVPAGQPLPATGQKAGEQVRAA